VTNNPSQSDARYAPFARFARFAAVPLMVASLAACGGQEETEGDSSTESVSGSVAVDGSSTVFPLSDAAAELLSGENPDIKVSVGEAGTGGGFEVFCEGKTDVSDASRPIEQEEIDACAAAGIEYVELQVATDALTVVGNPDVPVDCLTVDQLKSIWNEGSKVKNWSEVDKSLADEEIALFGPGTDSGTFDYFTEQINGEEGVSRSDYEASEDDNVIAQGVAGTPGALGYFGYTYYEQNQDSLKAITVDSGAGCVAPSAETAADGSYSPLSRPLFIYVNKASYSDNAAVKAYVDYYVENLPELTEAAQFIALNDDQSADMLSKHEELAG
jgi:phosphate transport system substrate-binding protein